jgi:hypothetical protein
MASVQDLINKYNGTKINTDGADAGQCTAVPHAWEEMNGWPVVLGNAKDTLGNAPSAVYLKVTNTPTNAPVPGSIVVWGPTWGGGLGHTAVVVASNINTFECFEQNDGDNGLAHVGTHNYSGVEGWFTPLTLSAPVVQAPPVGAAFPRTVPIHEIVNVRTSPKVSAPVVGQLHVGTCVITAQTGGDSGTVGTHTSSLWYQTQGGHWFNSAVTE